MAELDELRIADKKHIGLAEMLKGGVIMDVTTGQQAKIAEDAGAGAGMELRRIGEGAAMIRTKGEAGSGNIVEAVRHMRALTSGIRRLTTLSPEELMTEAKNLGAPYELVRWVARAGKLPVPNFSAGGIATPADAALMMQLGAEAVFVGSGIFKSSDPARRAKAIVHATTHYKDPDVLARVSEELGDAMVGIETAKLSAKDP